VAQLAAAERRGDFFYQFLAEIFLMTLCRRTPYPLSATHTLLPLSPFSEKVEMYFASLNLVNLLWVRLHCYSDPGSSLSGPKGLD
jgi:hypothetical protein